MALIPVDAIGADAASTGLPSHLANDLIIIFAYNHVSNTIPSLPAGYIPLQAAGGDTNAARVGYKIAATSSEVSGSWTNATRIVAHVIRGQNATTPIGSSTIASAAATAIIQYPALTLQEPNGTSFVLGFAGHRTATNLGTANPAGMINRSTAPAGNASGKDTNGGVTTWPLTNMSVNGTSAWRAITVEVRAEQLPPVNFAWDANTEPDIVGYRLYAGRQSGVYAAPNSPKEMGNTTTGFFAINVPGTWFFALTAHDTELLESGFSNEVFATFPEAKTVLDTMRSLADVIHKVMVRAIGTEVVLGLDAVRLMDIAQFFVSRVPKIVQFVDERAHISDAFKVLRTLQMLTTDDLRALTDTVQVLAAPAAPVAQRARVMIGVRRAVGVA